MCNKCGSEYYSSICNCELNTEQKEFKVGEEWLTRDGRTATIIANDIKAAKPIVCRVKCDGLESIMCYFSNGFAYPSSESMVDLIKLKPKPVLAWMLIKDGKPYGTWNELRQCKDTYPGFPMYRIEYIPGEIPKVFEEKVC